MLCLGIETSCDETALALVRNGVCVDMLVASQGDVHALFGGVVPELASREHYRFISTLYDILMERSGVKACELDAIAVTRGPGLLGALLVGVAFAKGLALGLSCPLIGVNHLHAHIMAVSLTEPIPFPALALLISGGHTHLYEVLSPLEFRLLGRTLDDAAGEACDKFAKMLGLPYPGGALLDALACRGEPDARLFPRPYTRLAGGQTLDFSFSGLKTAALTYVRAHPELIDAGRHVREEGLGLATAQLCDVCASYLMALTDTLQYKCAAAFDVLQKTGKPQSYIIAGGVAANTQVRAMGQAFAKERDIPLLIPTPALCTDNAAMIAYLGSLQVQAGICHPLDFAAFARGQHEPLDYIPCLPCGS